MKIRKSTTKCLAWTLVFFLAMAGFARSADRCKGECCHGPQEPYVKKHPTVNEPGPLAFVNLKTSLDVLLPACHLPGSSGDYRRAVAPQKDACRNMGIPSCCHMGKPEARVQALVSQGYSWGADRPFHVDLVVCKKSHDFLNENQRNLPVDGGGLQPRAAPVPLYLKNTAFIC